MTRATGRRTRTFCLLCATVGLALVVLAAGQSGWSQDGSLVVLDVLNEVPPGEDRIIVIQGEPVEVQFEVEPAADTTPLDSIRLCRVDDGTPVSQKLRGEGLSGTALLSTRSDDALGWLETIYVHVDGTVLAVAEESVLVVERAPDPLRTVVVPSPEAPTIQAAIDLVPDGGVVKIKPGDYEVNLLEPIIVTGKSVTIQGAGSSRRARPGRDKLTRLIAPPPTEVVDAALATGVINYIDAGGILKDLDVSGGDACVVGRDPGERAESLRIEDACLSNTGRGVLWKAPSEVAVVDCRIENCLWNGISFSPGAPAQLTVGNSSVESIFNIGILVVNSYAYYEDVALLGCDGGGIVAHHSIVGVVDSWFQANSFAAIALFESAGVVTDNTVWWTYAVPSGPKAGKYGDGVDAVLCPLVIVTGNEINYSDRASIGIFGSTMKLGSNMLTCDLFDVTYEEYQGVPAVLQVLDDNNACGCPWADGDCGAQSPSLEPPVPSWATE